MLTWRWLLLVCSVAAAARAAPAPLEVAGNLDLASFPNSLRLHVAKPPITFAAYGFTELLPDRYDPATAEVEDPSHTWLFRVTVLDGDGQEALICVQDRALNGRIYLTQFPMVVRRGDNGLYRAVASDDDARCGRVLR